MLLFEHFLTIICIILSITRSKDLYLNFRAKIIQSVSICNREKKNIFFTYSGTWMKMRRNSLTIPKLRNDSYKWLRIDLRSCPISQLTWSLRWFLVYINLHKVSTKSYNVNRDGNLKGKVPYNASSFRPCNLSHELFIKIYTRLCTLSTSSFPYNVHMIYTIRDMILQFSSIIDYINDWIFASLFFFFSFVKNAI